MVHDVVVPLETWRRLTCAALLAAGLGQLRRLDCEPGQARLPGQLKTGRFANCVRGRTRLLVPAHVRLGEQPTWNKAGTQLKQN